MIEVLREFRQAAQREIEIAENKLRHISWEENPSAYDYWTWVLFTAQRKRRRAVVFAKRVEREERLYAEIRGHSSPIQRPEPVVVGEAHGIDRWAVIGAAERRRFES